MGRPVNFSDDSMLTLYAQERGLTVQQPSAICFTAMPEKLSHFNRMYLRWMRGSTIRSIWRMRYLTPSRPAFWLHTMRWIQMVLTQMVTIWMLVVEPLVYADMPPTSMLVVPFLIGWAQGLRYLSIIRSDERIRSRLLTWLAMCRRTSERAPPRTEECAPFSGRRWGGAVSLLLSVRGGREAADGGVGSTSVAGVEAVPSAV
ncbi:hypothetical protein [Streptomyces avermitilis]|uniref:hypothetical protein n=1 Tax=Streptomyces avermitilis TaxID=33903 RepID=UPI0036A1C670